MDMEAGVGGGGAENGVVVAVDGGCGISAGELTPGEQYSREAGIEPWMPQNQAITLYTQQPQRARNLESRRRHHAMLCHGAQQKQGLYEQTDMEEQPATMLTATANAASRPQKIRALF